MPDDAASLPIFIDAARQPEYATAAYFCAHSRCAAPCRAIDAAAIFDASR